MKYGYYFKDELDKIAINLKAMQGAAKRLPSRFNPSSAKKMMGDSNMHEIGHMKDFASATRTGLSPDPAVLGSRTMAKVPQAPPAIGLPTLKKNSRNVRKFVQPKLNFFDRFK